MEIGHVEALFRYPVKSMSGEKLEAANLGWHGLEGDRRLAFQLMFAPPMAKSCPPSVRASSRRSNVSAELRCR
jgi:hypothetical protein